MNELRNFFGVDTKSSSLYVESFSYPLDFPKMKGKKVRNTRQFNHNEFVLITIFSNPQKTREIKVLDVKTLRKIETLHISIRADGGRKVSIVGNRIKTR